MSESYWKTFIYTRNSSYKGMLEILENICSILVTEVEEGTLEIIEINVQ